MLQSNNIILIGFMGSGKSTVGKILSKKLNMHLIDTDIEIEKEIGMKILNIFQIYGESFFRKLETELLERLTTVKNSIIATGGGMIISEKNKNLLKKIGKIFYLRISESVFTKRVKYDKNRPLKGVPNLYKKRLIHYRKLADFVIDCDYLFPEEISLKILNLYENSC